MDRTFNCMELQGMSDQELAVQAISEAQHILEEYLEPRQHDNERLLDGLEVLERPSVLVAVDRLRSRRRGHLSSRRFRSRALAILKKEPAIGDGFQFGRRTTKVGSPGAGGVREGCARLLGPSTTRAPPWNRKLPERPRDSDANG